MMTCGHSRRAIVISSRCSNGFVPMMGFLGLRGKPCATAMATNVAKGMKPGPRLKRQNEASDNLVTPTGTVLALQ